MEITFLENGIDSLQKGFNAFLDFEKEIASKAPNKEDYLTLKEAVLSTEHGIEILLKYILFQKSEFLIVDKIDDLYIQALSEKEKQNRRSVFDTPFSDNVHTITFKEALNRVKQLSQVILSVMK